MFNVLVPLGGSDLAEEVLAPAGRLAGALGAELVLLRAAPPAAYPRTGPRIVSAPPSYAVTYQDQPGGRPSTTLL